MWLEEIKTQFVRDRVRETPFDNRAYVRDLYLLEQLQRGLRLGWAFHAYQAKKLLEQYPAEAECIRLELADGQYVDPARFEAQRREFASAWHARQKEKQVARDRQEEHEAATRLADAAEELQREQDLWQEMGGSV